MTTTGATQYALAAAAAASGGGANSGGGGGNGGSPVGVDTKPSVVVVTTSSSNVSGATAQSQPGRGQQLITVVASDPSSPNSLQPIQVGVLYCFLE